MIVSRGIGRSLNGASGIIVAAGLGLAAATTDLTGGMPIAVSAAPKDRFVIARIDDRDLLDILPIIVEVINGRR